MSLCEMIERRCSVGDLAVKLVLMKYDDAMAYYEKCVVPIPEYEILEFKEYVTDTGDNTCER